MQALRRHSTLAKTGDTYSRPIVPSRLGIGPISKNVIDAAIRLAHRRRHHVMLITSRAQVDSAELGCGYVEGWSTELLARYIRARDRCGLVMICRDHGGPWQHPREVSCALDEAGAMDRSLVSLRCDIASGMRILHLDTSREASGRAHFDAAVRRLIELYGECHEYAASLGRKVAFEIGIESQSRHVDDAARFGSQLECILGRLREAALPQPTFAVAQTGTLVIGMRNRGMLAEHPRRTARKVRELAERCWEHGVALKAHNVDYLTCSAVRELVRGGADALNLAPEFGVVESLAFLTLLQELRLNQERDEFMQLAYDSGGWCKWFCGDHGTDEERSIVAGHYVFASDEFRDVKQRAETACRKRQAGTVDGVLGAALDHALDRYAATIWPA